MVVEIKMGASWEDLLVPLAPQPPPALYTRSRVLLLDQVVGQRQPLWQRRLYETVQGFQTQSGPPVCAKPVHVFCQTKICGAYYPYGSGEMIVSILENIPPNHWGFFLHAS